MTKAAELIKLVEQGSSFKNTYVMGVSWFNNFSGRNRMKFEVKRDGVLRLVYDKHDNDKHVLTFNTATGQVFTDYDIKELR